MTMITSQVTLDQTGCVLAIETTGHAYSEHSSAYSSAKDVKHSTHSTHCDTLLERSVCTAVSTTEQQFFYALKSLTTLNPVLTIKHERGYFNLSIPHHHTLKQTLSPEMLQNWKTLSQAFCIGYKMILSQHPEAFKVTWTTLASVNADSPITPTAPTAPIE